MNEVIVKVGAKRLTRNVAGTTRTPVSLLESAIQEERQTGQT
jgi:hypothetical protein